MAALFGALTLGLSALSARAAPTPENVALARKFAPEFRFHQDEKFFPSTVEFFLKGVFVADRSGNRVEQPEALTASNVDDVQNQGADLFLTTDVNANKDGFLRGQDPRNAESQPATYTFVVAKDNNVVDVVYWQFSPFNGAKDVPVLGRVGDHVGDWERLLVRTVDGNPVSADYKAHGNKGSGTLPWDQIEKIDNGQRPIAYIANGSHGLWAAAGTFTYVDAVILKLQDETSADGFHWDSKDSIVPLTFPDTYTGDLEWLNFKGKWGNPGTTDCFWHFIHPECEIVDGPGGPIRDEELKSLSVGDASTAAPGSDDFASKFRMDGPLSQTLATVSDADESTFTVYLTAPPVQLTKFLTVEQRCGTFNATSEQTTYTASTFASAPLTAKKTAYELAPSACAEGTVVAAYALGVCSSAIEAGSTTAEDAGCSFNPTREVRAFTPGVKGIQQAAAIKVEDLDNWTL